MIIKTVEDDFFDVRIRLTEKKKTIGLKEGEWLEFVTAIRTREPEDDNTKGIKEIAIRTDQTDDEGKYVIQIDLEEINACAGRYGFEVNIIRADGKKVCLLRNDDNSFIIGRRVR